MTLASNNSITLSYVGKILAGVARSGVSLEELFQEAGLDLALLSRPDARLDVVAFSRLLQIVMRRTEDEFIGLWRGGRSKPGTFSMMAHAVINCRNLEKAIVRSSEFYALLNQPAHLRLQVDGDQAWLDLGVAEGEARDILLESMVFISVRFWSWLVGQNIRPSRIELDFPEPSEAREYRYLFSCPVVFGCPCSRIMLPARLLQLPLVQNPLSLSRFLRDSLAVIIQGNLQPIGLADQIRALISREYDHNFPDFSQVCEQLNMTPQTLRRRLKEANTSYQEIKDNIRHDAAVYYLSKAELSIDEIALMMGFSEASSFHRAFKKWTGRTPASYRHERLGLAAEESSHIEPES